MAIISLQVDIASSSAALRNYIIGALENPNVLCLFGSRMFINLIEAGQSDVKNESGNGVQSGGGSIVSDIQFGDPSGPRSGKYILQDAGHNPLTLAS